MQSSQVYRLLVRRIRRGLIIFSILWLVSSASGGLALICPGGRPWAVAAFLAGILFYLGADHVRKRDASAWRVSENPQLVYWAHPMTPHQPLSDRAIHDCTLLMLHLRDGTEFEVGLPVAEMRSFVTWLSERNPSVRWGVYDNIDSTITRRA